MPPMLRILLFLLILFLLFGDAHAFGAGSIPNYAYLHKRAFRHGDLANVLAAVHKIYPVVAPRKHHTRSFLGKMTGLNLEAEDETVFSKADIAKIYFGNWLRDYSQAMDTGSLASLSFETLMTLVQILGFMTFGFATEEFEITPERLGVYSPVEHIDNPSGYAAGSDARHYHPDLRPPVDPRELKINAATGIKNYIATEGYSWDTSTAFIRRTLTECIRLGRLAHGKENDNMWEAFRLLGTGLHTLEDFLAHSNWCELSLRKLGYREVFCHVGDKGKHRLPIGAWMLTRVTAVRIKTPQGTAPPLVTGTFGSADFIHSILGEATDHLTSASVEDLARQLDKKEGKSSSWLLRSLLSRLPLESEDKDASIQSTHHIEERANRYYRKNKTYSFESAHGLFWEVLVWRDAVMRMILEAVESIPGLSALFEEVVDSINSFVFTLLSPILVPILAEVTAALQEQSREVIDTRDQFEVFTNAYASDPSHSVVSKDHFNLILNEPAGMVAKTVVEYATELIVRAWYDESVDVRRIIDKIMEVIHHPYFSSSSSVIQKQMLATLKVWISGIPPEIYRQTFKALTKEEVREGRNTRIANPVTKREQLTVQWNGGSDSYIRWDDEHEIESCRIM